ncbi:MAG: hypothetical protein ACOY0T_37500 [Myxococcota bacterium]
MALPKAVTSSTKTPGFYLRIDLLAGPANAGSSALRALLVAHALPTGDITPDDEVRRCYRPDDVALALGNGSIGHLAAIQMFLAFGALDLDVVAPAAPSGATAQQTLSVAGAPTDTNQFLINIAGRDIGPIAWGASETIGVFRARVITAINGFRPLPVQAQNGIDPDDVDIVALGPGSWGNDITIRVTKLGGTGGAVTVGGARLAGGAGEFNATLALAKVGTTEYAAIGLATSNADATLNTASSNAERLQNHIEWRKYGLGALLQYGFVGHTGTIANVKTGAIARNATDLTYAFVQNAQSLPAEVMGWELGDCMNWYQQRANYSRIGNRAPYLFGSSDPNGDQISPPESEDLLSNGVAPYDFAPNSTELALVAPITTHSLDDAGNADVRCYYQSDVWGQNAIARDLRVAIQQEFAHASITPDLPPNADALPPGVVERKDVYNFSVSRVKGWGQLGVANIPYLEQVIANGTFAVEIDEDDESQVNIFIPDRIVKPLAKFSAVFHKTG